VHFLNSQPFLEFLQQLTGIKETLIPDPYFEGGGFHEIKPGGYLKMHVDFHKHKLTKLDRRLNILVYLNEDWKEEYGGHFELMGTRYEQMCNQNSSTVQSFSHVFNNRFFLARFA
jgi:Rps23 Pro-64 3,4-dihydroxylase Tpa1-like proline 4-hydroxylase